VIERYLHAGARVALGDGAGMPLELAGELPGAAEAVGGVSLLLGWCLQEPFAFPQPGFDDIRAVMGGYGLRSAIGAGHVRYIPVRYGDLPSLLHGPLRVDVLLASLVPADGGLSFATEVGWQHAAVEAGAVVLAEVNHGLPRASATRRLPSDRVVVVAETDRPPITRDFRPPSQAAVEIGRQTASLIPAGAGLEVSPGEIGDAVLAALARPVRMRTGAVTDGVLGLAERELLADTPVASYVVGSSELMAWADGRPIAAGIDVTHDPARAGAFVAVNTALEIDELGNVNAQGVGDDVSGGIGGIQDFGAAAARSPQGLSVIALPSERGGRCTLVDQLSAPASLPRSLVEIVVTEHGLADLRGLSDAERAGALHGLFPVAVSG
jgi:acyl-CoA hydrolase